MNTSSPDQPRFIPVQPSAGFDPTAWIAQATAAGMEPTVILQPDGSRLIWTKVIDIDHDNIPDGLRDKTQAEAVFAELVKMGACFSILAPIAVDGLPAAPIPASESDDPIPTLVFQWWEEHAKLATIPEDRPERNAIVAALGKIEFRIIHTPATSARGVADKVCFAAHFLIRTDDWTFADLDWDQKMVVSAADDAAALADTISEGDTHLRCLEQELLASIANINAQQYVTEDEADRIMNRIAELTQAINQEPAFGPEGLAIKLRRLQASHNDGATDWDADAISTALETCARMGVSTFVAGAVE